MITSSYKYSHLILCNKKRRGVLQCIVFSSYNMDEVNANDIVRGHALSQLTVKRLPFSGQWDMLAREWKI